MSLPFPREMQPVFRRMMLADLDAVMTIEEVSFPTPWSAGTYRREIERSRYGSYWVVSPGEGANSAAPPLLAYGGMWCMGEEAHVTTIAVHPQWRQRGLGEWTLLHLIGVARARGAEVITLEVRESNEAAIRLYRKLGFQKVGRRRGYYIDAREDALLMSLFAIDQPAQWRRLQEERMAIEARDGHAPNQPPG
jgi:[ribosomal protein S18]-alanine N-acetyltransferase